MSPVFQTATLRPCSRWKHFLVMLMQQPMTLSVYHCLVVEEQRWWLTGECCNALRFWSDWEETHMQNSSWKRDDAPAQCLQTRVKCFLWINVMCCCSATLKLENYLRQCCGKLAKSVSARLNSAVDKQKSKSKIFKPRVQKYIKKMENSLWTFLYKKGWSE